MVHDRRHDTRHRVSRPVELIPVTGTGAGVAGPAPDLAHRTQGEALDVSTGGMRLRVPHASSLGQPAVGQEFVLSVRTNGDFAYAGVVVRYVHPQEKGVTFGTSFESGTDRMLRPDNLMPVLNPARFSFTLPFPAEGLEQWASAGVLRPVLLDQVKVCPRCKSLPTFRDGCRSCSSGRIVPDQYVHHFACANVDRAENFQVDGQMVCPKCRTRNLVIGADYEHLHAFRCLDCNWSDWQPELIGHCLNCSHRFASHQAIDRPLIGYEVHHLEPEELVPQPGDEAHSFLEAVDRVSPPHAAGSDHGVEPPRAPQAPKPPEP